MYYVRELPPGTTSVLLTNNDRKVRVEAYKNSEVIGIIPNEKTSTAFVTECSF